MPIAQPSRLRHSPGETVAPPEIPRLSTRDTARQRAVLRARETGNMLLSWSLPLIMTAVLFAAVIIWFWWAA